MLLNAEYGTGNDLLSAIARETTIRNVLLLVFVILQVVGFMLIYRVCRDVPADNLTRIVASMPVLFFLNLTAVLCIPRINATNERISHLREHFAYCDNHSTDQHI